MSTPEPESESDALDGVPVQTDNSAEGDLVLPQDPNWRPVDAIDVAP